MILTMNVSELNQSKTCICHKLLKMIKKIGIKYLETELAKIFFINTSWSSIQRPHTIFSIKKIYLLMQTINLA